MNLILLAAIILNHVAAQPAADRIRQAQYCAAVQRRDQRREADPVHAATAAKGTRSTALSRQELAQLREALARLARCSTGELVRDQASGFYLPQQKAGCR